MVLLRRGDLSVTEVCFTVGCSSLGTFSTRFNELVGIPPGAYRRQAARPMAGVPDQNAIIAVAGIQQPGDRCCVFSYSDYVDYRDGNSVLDGIIAG